MRKRHTSDCGRRSWRRRLARAGQIGFLLFFLKGLAWLVIPIGILIGR